MITPLRITNTACARNIPVIRFTDQGKSVSEGAVAKEFPLTIILNDLELVTLLCSPANVEYLAVGFLFAEGIVKNKNEILCINADDKRGVVRVTTEAGNGCTPDLVFKRLITSACGRGAAYYSSADAYRLSKVESYCSVTPDEVFSLVNEFNSRSALFKTTGGVHSAALADNNNILVFGDDLGRHNAVDKVFGECLLNDIPTEGRIILTSGRVPSEMVLKSARGNVPILVSIGATSDLGIRLADDLGVTLIGFARGKQMTVYTNTWRINSNY